LKSDAVKVPPEQLAKMKNDPTDIANMTSVTSRNDQNKTKSMLDLGDQGIKKQGTHLSTNENAEPHYNSRTK